MRSVPAFFQVPNVVKKEVSGLWQKSLRFFRRRTESTRERGDYEAISESEDGEEEQEAEEEGEQQQQQQPDDDKHSSIVTV